MSKSKESFIDKLIRETKEQVMAQGGPKVAIKGCAPATLATKVAKKQTAPNEADLRAAAAALGVKFTGGTGFRAPTQTLLAVQRRVERPVPGVVHPVLQHGNTELRYSHRALERLIRADLAVRGNGGAVTVAFDDLGAVVTQA